MAKKVEKMGAVHKNCSVNDIVIDIKNRIVTTPAYMLGKGISEVAISIEKLVKEVVNMV